MPRRRRDRDEDGPGGEFERGAQGRRAPLYAVLARELLRHLGDPLAQVARVGELPATAAAGAVSATSRTRTSAPAPVAPSATACAVA